MQSLALVIPAWASKLAKNCLLQMGMSAPYNRPCSVANHWTALTFRMVLLVWFDKCNTPKIKPCLHPVGVEIISNSSGSHHELRKLDTRVNLITQATKLVMSILVIWMVTVLTNCRAEVFTYMQTNKAVMVIGCTTMDVQWSWSTVIL